MTNMIEENIIFCYYSTKVELLMVKYFPKHHSLTLLSHLASLFLKVEVFFNHRSIVFTNFYEL